MSPRIKRLLPWVLSIGFVAFLFATTDLDAVADALAAADWAHLLVGMAAVTSLAYGADSLTLIPLVRRFIGPARAAEVFRVKGVSYFLNAVNYSLAAGGMAWLLSRKRELPFMRAFSPLVWLFFVDIIALGLMLALGFALHHERFVDPDLAARLPIVLVVIGAVVLGSLLYWNAGFDFIAFSFFRRWRIFATFSEARLGDYLRFVPMRMAFICVYVLMHWLLLPAFGVSIPLGALIAYAPLLTFVQVIPATISGLGAVQSLMVVLFAAHVPEASNGPAVILAYSTVLGPAMVLLRLGIGYAFVARVSADLVPDKGTIEAARQGSEKG